MVNLVKIALLSRQTGEGETQWAGRAVVKKGGFEGLFH